MSTTKKIGSPFFWHATSHQFVVGYWHSGPTFKGFNV